MAIGSSPISTRIAFPGGTSATVATLMYSIGAPYGLLVVGRQREGVRRESTLPPTPPLKGRGDLTQVQCRKTSSVLDPVPTFSPLGEGRHPQAAGRGQPSPLRCLRAGRRGRGGRTSSGR